jgi:hypothetical protein
MDSLRRVVEFLSDEWIASFDRLLRDADIAGLAPFILEQIVRDVPGRGEVRYRLIASEDGIAVMRSSGTNGGPNVSFATDYATAVALARGTENAQHALGAGRLRLGGDLVLLAARAEVLAALDDVSARLREQTSYPEG